MLRPQMPLTLSPMIDPATGRRRRIELCPRCCGPLGTPAALAVVRGVLVPVCTGCTHGRCRPRRALAK